MTDLVLYHSPGSRSGRVKAPLERMKVPHEIVEVSLERGDDADAQANLAKLIDRRIGEPFVLGERMSAVDVLLHGQLGFLTGVGLFDELPRARAYYARHQQTIPSR